MTREARLHKLLRLADPMRNPSAPERAVAAAAAAKLSYRVIPRDIPDAIVLLLAEGPREVRVLHAELRQRWGWLVNPRSVATAAGKLVKVGKLQRVRQGCYALR